MIDTIKSIDIRSAVLSSMKDKVNNGIIITDIAHLYDQDWRPAVAEYDARTSRQKYLEHPHYTHFRTIVWEAAYEGRPVPNMRKIIKAEEGDEDEDDEIEIGAQQTDFKCPITMSILQDPLSS